MSDKLQAETARRLHVALTAARTAAAVTLVSYQKQDLKVDVKADRTVVTDADRDAEALLRQVIAKSFGADAVVGEEYGEQSGTSGWTWHLDPIDGTQAFVRGVPMFGTLIGVEFEGVIRAGVICMPATREMIYASRGEGCHWVRDLAPDGRGDFAHGAPRLARVSGVTSLDAALFCTTWMRSFVDSGRTDLYTKLCAATEVARTWGDCYGYALVATGRAELMLDPMLNVWDAAPMPVILAEAGGKFTSFAGAEDIRAGSAVATNGHLHEAVMRLIQA